MTNHTPGPWTVGNSFLRGMPHSVLTDEKDPRLVICHVDDVDGFEGNSEANARLIADAPRLYYENIELKQINAELLEALKDLLGGEGDIFTMEQTQQCVGCGRDYSADYPDDPIEEYCTASDCPRFLARAVIAKAEGRKP